MKKPKKIFAFIDSQNLHRGVKSQGWDLDWSKFRQYLRNKYKVSRVFVFIGYKVGNESLYTKMQEMGYIVILKPTLELPDGTVKGNCDADLVLHAMLKLSEYFQAIIVSGDGDFHSLIKHLREKNKLKMVLVPDQARYSVLLNDAAAEKIAFISDQRKKLEYKKAPR